MENSANSHRPAAFLGELRSGRLQAALPPKPGKRKRNRVYIDAAIAAGYSETTALRWRRDIAPRCGGELECERAYLEGMSSIKGNSGSKKPKAAAEQVSLQSLVPEGERFDAGNPAHVGIAKIAGAAGPKAATFLRIRHEYKSDYQAMKAAGYSEQQARHPERLRKSLGKLAGPEIMAALEFYGVDSARVAEVLAQIFNTTTLREVPTGECNSLGDPILRSVEVPDPNSVHMALSHIEKLMAFMGPPPAQLPPGANPESIEAQERTELHGLLRQNGLIAN